MRFTWIKNILHHDNKEPVKEPLSTHIFFYDMSKFINIEIDKIVLPNKSKQKLVREFLRIILTVYRDNFLEFIEDHENFKDSHRVQEMMDKCVIDYRRVARNFGVPDLFLEKFDFYYGANFVNSTEYIKQVCDSNFHTSEESRIMAILDALNYAFRTLVMTVEVTINGMNGELESSLIGTKFDVIIE